MIPQLPGSPSPAPHVNRHQPANTCLDVAQSAENLGLFLFFFLTLVTLFFDNLGHLLSTHCYRFSCAHTQNNQPP